MLPMLSCSAGVSRSSHSTIDHAVTEQTPIAGLDWIAVDWGTSSLRVWAVARDGSVLDTRASQDGMGKLDRDEYEDALLRLIGDFLPPASASPVHIIVCGMAGARGGWREAGYRAVPCEPLAAGDMTRVETRDRRIAVHILPGLSQAAPADVIRGEETQLAGLVSRIGDADATACLPGTHSKWVRLKAGKVVSFRTFMTGELFAILAANSILRLSVAADGEDPAMFLSATREMLDGPQDLTAALFSIRASSVLEGLGETAARSRLSGLLVGAELAATFALWRDNPVHLVGSDDIADRYADAIEDAGGAVIREDAERLTLSGLSGARSLIREAAR
jgi:2-dehydro-3-deoxygalactonokinase